MELAGQYHFYIAVFTARIFLGCLFFFQGYDAVFKIKIRQVIHTFEEGFAQKGIPRAFTAGAAWFTSCSALIGGGLLIPGLFIYPALYLLSLNLIIAAIGFGISTPMWDLRHVWPRLILLLFLVMMPPACQAISLDHLCFNN